MDGGIAAKESAGVNLAPAVDSDSRAKLRIVTDHRMMANANMRIDEDVPSNLGMGCNQRKWSHITAFADDCGLSDDSRRVDQRHRTPPVGIKKFRHSLPLLIPSDGAMKHPFRGVQLFQNLRHRSEDREPINRFFDQLWIVVHDGTQFPER